MTLNPNELNYMVYRYLLEQNYEHAAFAFFNEADVVSFAPEPQLVPKGLLVALMQKALQILDIEMHVDSKGYLHPCTRPFSLFEPHNCSTASVLNYTLNRYYSYLITKSPPPQQVLRDLPQPILLDSNALIEKIYAPPKMPDQGYSEQLEKVLYRRYERMAGSAEELPNQYEDYTEKYNQELAISHTSVLYLLDKLYDTHTHSQQSFEQFVRQVQLYQNQPPSNVLDTPQQLITFSAYLKPTNSRITYVRIYPLRKLLKVADKGQFKCSCADFLCVCDEKMSDSDATPADEVENYKILAAGDASGQVMVCIFSEREQLLNVLPNFTTPSGVCQICFLQHRNRIIIGHQDGTVRVFKINVDFKADDHRANVEFVYIYQSQPFGVFNLSQLFFATLNTYLNVLVAAGEGATPMIMDMANTSVSRAYTSIGDALEYVPAELMLGNTYNGALSYESPDTLAACVFHDFVVSMRSDGKLCLAYPGRSDRALFLDIEQEFSKVFECYDYLFVFTKTEVAFVVYPEQAKLQRFCFDAQVVDAVATTQGVACLLGRHVVLLGGIEGEIPQIKLDWALNTVCTALFVQDEFVIAVNGATAVRIDPKVDNFTVMEPFKEADITTADGSAGCYCMGSSTGCIHLEVTWPLNY